ncbi:hypothetical protein ARTHRO9V_40001 [Arthrobacter sp. 9V]|nr:hypothetical protein ARTHRO9V_40001 [Arthrobacter sp. 9V]
MVRRFAIVPDASAALPPRPLSVRDDASDQETPPAALARAAAFVRLMKYAGLYTTYALLSAIKPRDYEALVLPCLANQRSRIFDPPETPIRQVDISKLTPKRSARVCGSLPYTAWVLASDAGIRRAAPSSAASFS